MYHKAATFISLRQQMKKLITFSLLLTSVSICASETDETIQRKLIGVWKCQNESRDWLTIQKYDAPGAYEYESKRYHFQGTYTVKNGKLEKTFHRVNDKSGTTVKMAQYIQFSSDTQMKLISLDGDDSCIK
jgi:hypothetical protein